MTNDTASMTAAQIDIDGSIHGVSDSAICQLAKSYCDLEKRMQAAMEVVEAAKIECQRLNESGMTTLYFPLMKALEKFESANG